MRRASRYGLGITSLEPARPSPLGLVPWLAGIAGITAAALVIAVRWRSGIDENQQEALLVALARLDLGGAFAGPTQTSGPGFGLVMVAPFALARLATSQRDAYLTVSYLALVSLVPATIAASRAVGVRGRSGRELVNLAAVMVSVPVLGAYLEAFHPADVLATALCLVAFAASCRGRWAWTCGLLGVAVATRQWAIVVVAVLAVASDGRERRVVAVGSLAVAGVLIVPFLLAEPDLTMTTLAAKTVWRYPFTAPGLAPLGPAARFAVARYVPLALVVVLCLWLHRRIGRGRPDAVVAALAAGLLMRPLVDPAGFAYYAIAAFPFLVLMRPASWRWPLIGTGLSVTLGVRRLLLDQFPAFAGLDPTGWVPPDVGHIQPVGAALSVAVSVVTLAVLAAALAELARLTVAGPAPGQAGAVSEEQGASMVSDPSPRPVET